ncbi:MAG: hypothetical protein LBQ82_03625 [Treponema sp.]|jgi:hypothetical protein|nr:hypothetical protein [Treponema sp.]
MGIIKLVKYGLFINECIRILFLAAYAILQPSEQAGIPRFVYITPAALFPIMALFILIDTARYRVYLPLFTAGKCIGVCTLLVWIFFAGHHTMITEFSGVVVAELFLLSGDLFAIAVVLLIIRSDKKTTETPVLEDD